MSRKSHRQILIEMMKEKDLIQPNQDLLKKYAGCEVTTFQQAMDLLVELSENVPDGFSIFTWVITPDESKISLLHNWRQRNSRSKDWHGSVRGNPTLKNIILCIEKYLIAFEKDFKSNSLTDEEFKQFLLKRGLNPNK